MRSVSKPAGEICFVYEQEVPDLGAGGDLQGRMSFVSLERLRKNLLKERFRKMVQ